MSLYKDLVEKVKENKSFYINLNKKELRIGKKTYIKNGEVLKEVELIHKDDLIGIFDEIIDLENDSWNVIKLLYKKYKHSVPNNQYKDSGYFKALPTEELTDSELAFNIDRKLGQAILEGYILLASMSGWIVWENEDKWFWQDKYHEELIIIKNWVSG